MEYSAPGHPERPERIARTVPLLKSRHAEWEWRTPGAATDEMLLRAHTRAHLDRVKSATQDFDADTAAHPGIYEHAARAAGAAVDVARAALAGERAFSLMRPPGHHAMRDRAMGFVASATSRSPCSTRAPLANGTERVAIWDFSTRTMAMGTEDMRGEQLADHVLASIHRLPGYPGTGARSFENIHTLPSPR